MNKRKPLSYNSANREQSLVRRLEVYAFDDHIEAAHRRKPKPLCDYLRSTAPLTLDHREQLADLIHRYIQSKPRGRPPGAGRSPRAQVKRLWVARVRDLERQWHKTHAGECLPKGLRGTFIERVGGELAEDGDLYKIVKIKTDEIRVALERGKSKRHLKSR